MEKHIADVETCFLPLLAKYFRKFCFVFAGFICLEFLVFIIIYGLKIELALLNLSRYMLCSFCDTFCMGNYCIQKVAKSKFIQN